MAYGIPAGGFIGSPLPWSDGSALDTGYSDGSDWFFQMVFCATTCSIVSGYGDVGKGSAAAEPLPTSPYPDTIEQVVAQNTI